MKTVRLCLFAALVFVIQTNYAQTDTTIADRTTLQFKISPLTFLNPAQSGVAGGLEIGFSKKYSLYAEYQHISHIYSVYGIGSTVKMNGWKASLEVRRYAKRDYYNGIGLFMALNASFKMHNLFREAEFQRYDGLYNEYIDTEVRRRIPAVHILWGGDIKLYSDFLRLEMYAGPGLRFHNSKIVDIPEDALMINNELFFYTGIGQVIMPSIMTGIRLSVNIR